MILHWSQTSTWSTWCDRPHYMAATNTDHCLVNYKPKYLTIRLHCFPNKIKSHWRYAACQDQFLTASFDEKNLQLQATTTISVEFFFSLPARGDSCLEKVASWSVLLVKNQTLFFFSSVKHHSFTLLSWNGWYSLKDVCCFGLYFKRSSNSHEAQKQSSSDCWSHPWWLLCAIFGNVAASRMVSCPLFSCFRVLVKKKTRRDTGKWLRGSASRKSRKPEQSSWNMVHYWACDQPCHRCSTVPSSGWCENITGWLLLASVEGLNPEGPQLTFQ